MQQEMTVGSVVLGTDALPGDNFRMVGTYLKGSIVESPVAIELWCKETDVPKTSRILMATYTGRFSQADAALDFHRRLVSAFGTSHGEPVELVSYNSTDYDSDMTLLPGATPSKVQSYFPCADGTPDSEDFAASIETRYPFPRESEFEVKLTVRFVRPAC